MKGFTLVELLLAIVLVCVFILLICLTIKMIMWCL